MEINKVRSVAELVKILEESEPMAYEGIAQLLDIPAEDFKKYIHWKDKGYSRNCIERTKHFELLLLCWNAGDHTPIHCHGEQRCWVYQVSGELDEVIYKKNSEATLIVSHEQKLTSGATCYMDDSLGYHTLHNNSGKRVMSLHLYAKPIDSCTYFDTNVEGFVSKEMNYHSFKGELMSPVNVS